MNAGPLVESGTWRRAVLVGCAVVACGAGCIGCSDAPEAAVEPTACDALGLTGKGDVRVFVVGHRQSVSDAESYATFTASYRRHLAGITECLSTQRPNLIVFPENAALGALLLGSRGASARLASSSTGAFVEMLKSYQPAFQHYKSEYPSVGLRRQLLLALTDVTWRAFHETFGGIARDHAVWVLANADVAPAVETSDPDLVATLGDPEAADPSRAFVAQAPTALNSAYLFDPSGEVVGRVDKVFLVDAEEKDLDLANGSFSELAALTTPFARIGVATSRDAFYPPFMQRLEDLDVELVVQPEAFSGWTVEQLPGDWLPDVFTSSGWLHTQKHRTFLHSLNPIYTGNFLDLVFDGQSHITEHARPDQGLDAYVGQDRYPGWVAVGPWVQADPGRDDPALSLAERRAALRATGEALLPGSGAPNENGYVDSLIAADLALPAAADAPAVEVERDASLPESRAVAPSESGHQRNPELGSDGQASALVVWQDERTGSWRLRFAASSDGGATFGAATEVEPGATAAQRRPSVCVAPDGRVGVTWQEGDGSERIRAALAPAIGQPFEPPVDVSSASGAAWEPSCGFGPAGELWVAFSGFASGVAKVALAARPMGATSFGAPLPVDASTDGAARLLGTQVQPAISAVGGHVVWLDYRSGSWDVYASRFDGSTFTPSVRVDGDGTETTERLHGDPRVVALGDRVLVSWTDLRARRADPDVAFVTSDDAGATWSERRTVPGGAATSLARSSGGSAMGRSRPAPVLGASGAELVFQDLSPDKSGIFRSVLGADFVASTPARIDDTAASATHLTRPRAAKLGASTLVVWEDDREGAYRVYVSRLD